MMHFEEMETLKSLYYCRHFLPKRISESKAHEKLQCMHEINNGTEEDLATYKFSWLRWIIRITILTSQNPYVPIMTLFIECFI